MTGLAARFFGTALVYAVLGMTLGLIMGISHDHSQMPAHAHLLVIGWVSFALYGFFYHLFPKAADAGLARAHFWIAQVSFITMIVGLLVYYGGETRAEPVLGMASIGFLVSAVLFAVVALPVVTSRRPAT